VIGLAKQELVLQIAVCRVQLDTVEACLLREFRAVAESFDDAWDLVQFERTRPDEVDFGDITLLVANRSVLARTQGGWSDRCHPAGVHRVSLTSRVPDLQEDTCAFGMNGVDDSLSAFGVLLGVENI
jgi:hypothetical protein